MKTTFEILQETIETARKLGALDVKEQKLKNTPIEMPEIKVERLPNYKCDLLQLKQSEIEKIKFMNWKLKS